MPGARAYDFMYRAWAPWDSVGVRTELSAFLERGGVTPATHPRAVDLGCGTGANVVHLARQGFESHGVDFSRAALQKARARASTAGVQCDFALGDLTAAAIDGIEGPFDLLLDFGTLDDLGQDARRQMVATIDRLSRPGAVLLEWCFYGERAQLPRFSFTGPSRMIGAIEPGELETRFGARWDIDELASNPARHTACFVLTRR